jgi:uncharacterized YigZ family protein
MECDYMTKIDFTLLNDTEVSFEEKKSIFICNIKRIIDEKDAIDYINSIKLKYKDASHNVYAYITNNGISMRYSDDGEPQGTAGPPILEVLKREELMDVAAVVTRYFGGTLLGAGGLIRAYSTSCKQGIDSAKKIKRAAGCVFDIECDYEKYGKLNNYFQKKNVILKGNEFFENVTMKILCLDKDFEFIKCDIIEMMNGNDIIKKKNLTACFISDKDEIMEV